MKEGLKKKEVTKWGTAIIASIPKGSSDLRKMKGSEQYWGRISTPREFPPETQKKKKTTKPKKRALLSLTPERRSLR